LRAISLWDFSFFNLSISLLLLSASWLLSFSLLPRDKASCSADFLSLIASSLSDSKFSTSSLVSLSVFNRSISLWESTNFSSVAFNFSSDSKCLLIQGSNLLINSSADLGFQLPQFHLLRIEFNCSWREVFS